MAQKKINSATLVLVSMVVLAIGVKILFEMDPLLPLENKIYDSMCRLRQRKAANPVVIVAIDAKSIQNVGSWPWPRSHIAEIVRHLSDAGVHTLGLSLLYTSKELNPGLQELQNLRDQLDENTSKSALKAARKFADLLTQAEQRLDHDQQLIAAVRSARRVVLPLRFSLGKPEDKNAPELSGWLQMNSIELKGAPDDQDAFTYRTKQFRGILNNRPITARQVTEPYDDLSRKAGALGHLNLLVDGDGAVRKIPLLISYGRRDFLSFALQVSRKYVGARLRDVRAARAGLILRHLPIPTEKNHRMFIDFSGRQANIRQVSYLDVIDGNIPADMFRNKIVLLGVTAEGWVPRYRTPIKADLSAIEIEASAVENIINGKFISRPSWVFVLEVLALLYVGFFLMFVIPKVNPRIGALILGIFLLTWVGASVILFSLNGIWLKVLAPVILALLGLALASRQRRFAEKQDENIQLNKSLGLALQGQGMLDMAFENFVKCPLDDTSVKELLYNLGLDFERKRMFNKALAVYRHILKAGAFKDIKDRIKKLITLEKTLVMPAGSAQKETAFLLDGGSTRPTLGRYEILQELGHGAMGTVYLGKDPSINREVAIKTLNYAEIDAEELSDVKSRFFREAEAAGKLSHPNIVTIYDVGEDHDMAYIAMELLKGKDLTHYCQNGNRLALKRVLDVVCAVAEALGYAHSQQVVHRDIKPANIILLENDQVKVADFGIARVVSSSKTQTGIIFGTPNYMSPEQVAGKRVDGRSDLFSLGVVFYELLTGKRPFSGDSLTTLLYAVSHGDYAPLGGINPSTPPCCIEIVDQLLAKGVSKRYKSASQVVRDLRACLGTLR